jgi:hypothetical protein
MQSKIGLDVGSTTKTRNHEGRTKNFATESPSRKFSASVSVTLCLCGYVIVSRPWLAMRALRIASTSTTSRC